VSLAGEPSTLCRAGVPPARPPAAPAPRRGGVPRLLTPAGTPADSSLRAHLERHGPMPPIGSAAARARLWGELSRAGILGRGGAGFPVIRKLRAIAPSGRSPVVVANGTEGEPASDKDKVLLLQAPHLVVDGICAAAALVGARRAFLVVSEEVLPPAEAAVRERARELESGRAGGCEALRIEVVPAARGFVAGEASAVVNWVERGAPLPRMTPPRLAERGMGNRPTLVQNVETLAHLALVARHGADWYRTAGTIEEPGSMLVTLSGAFARRGVYEVAIGTPLLDVLDVGGADPEDLGAVLVGGYSASWVRADDVPALVLSRESLRRVGASPGAGIVAALPRNRCGLIESARVVTYLAGSSAGQCGPCVFGLAAIAGELELLARTGDADPARLRRWIDQVDGRGACAHPDGVARFARSALWVFNAEVQRHLEGECSGTNDEVVLPLTPAEGR
jgi:NADH:ubiquinone oxidoreductase subunit F (NADH-binding)